MVQITKSCKELKRVGILTECGQFIININGRIIKTKKSSAVCFSDLIQEKCVLNKSISSYEVNLDLKCEDSIDILSEFLETGKLDFEDESHSHDIFEIGKHFGNQLFIQVYSEHVKLDKSITKENVFQKYEISVFENDIITENECIRFISSHLYCLDDKDIIEHFVKNGYEFFEKIITSDELKIDNEDHLSLLLLSICKQNDTFFDLFRHIKLAYCSRETYDRIYNFCIEHSFERVLLSIYNEILKNYHSNIRENIEISNEPISSFEKLIIKNQFSISNNSFNVYDHMFVDYKEIKMELTASSVCSGRSISFINSYSNDEQFCSNDCPNSWIKADLKGYKLKPTSYVLQSNFKNDMNLLRKWKLEGIKEDGTTVVLDNDKYYEFKQSEIKEFPLQTKEYFVSFKLTQTGKTSSDEDWLIINIFDFKGELTKN
ncbi:hypothetical protein TVAG_035580 [Trichomonas vaginalis G3]|uniref:BACK domain-containing protein n=1 Tax=Trichomonas vaginalis (strain ATCC PRA-98 / G3) TaxID=412133 RepID=A2DAN2_TRIV3|nr:protein ubiquitination [Trichomonas vaginalis G3]EAY22535.1 hypothetical protein TVAG_035580 [Trichomonas vaginalis G3]KAI5497268.1 protein ubiquitination [Trichomonas vaginalis G3]|eukprot:XP_001583521.1 hypothetical protein [Trichomonas vaginalis G3]